MCGLYVKAGSRLTNQFSLIQPITRLISLTNHGATARRRETAITVGFFGFHRNFGDLDIVC